MKELCCLILLLWLLSGASLADEKLRLSQEDAKQLHAFLLTGELLDFGRRADSPGAYLMAVELMLDYPTADFDRVKALSLCRRARELAGGDPIFQSWAKRLELRASKTERGGAGRFVVRSGVLEAGAALYLPGDYEAVWVQGEAMSLQMRDPISQEIRSTNALRVRGLAPDQWWIFHKGTEPGSYRVLLKCVSESPSGSEPDE